MGIYNFKPSVSHQISNTTKEFNICQDPNLDNVTPKIDCTRLMSDPMTKKALNLEKKEFIDFKIKNL